MHKILFFLTALMVACCPCRHLATSEQDSVRVEVRERVVARIDSVEFQLPQERAERTVEADSSYIENTVAASWAIVQSDGKLYHSLFTLPRPSKVAVSIPTLHRDSIVYRQQYREIVVEVAKPLSWWQQTQIKGFWVIMIAGVIWVVLRKVGNHFWRI